MAKKHVVTDLSSEELDQEITKYFIERRATDGLRAGMRINPYQCLNDLKKRGIECDVDEFLGSALRAKQLESKGAPGSNVSFDVA